MGLNFSKELHLKTAQIYPATDSITPTDVQERLLKKLGGNAYPFSIELPQTAPCSVQLQAESVSCEKFYSNLNTV